VLLAELCLHVFFPGFQLPYAQAGFSARYHHASQDFAALLKQIQVKPEAFRGDITVAVLGDSFVAGNEVDKALRFTSIMQRYCDSLPEPRIKVVNLGIPSYSTLIYERLYRDVVLPLDPDIVIVCLDQTDVADDILYEQELTSRPDGAGAVLANSDFNDTVLKHYESYPLMFFLLRNSQLFLRAHLVKQRFTGTGFIPENTDRVHAAEYLRASERERQKLTLYFETCKDPKRHGRLFENSEKYIRSISQRKPAHQELYFVTYPRAENLAGQRKSTILHGALPDSYASTPYFEFWIKEANMAERYANLVFIHTSSEFRSAIASRDRQLYFHIDDVHWNADGHKLFAEILVRRILSKIRER
jgi:lysophospholipase L1-like esterase